MKRKHVFLTVAGFAAGLSLLILSGCSNPRQAANHVQDNSLKAYQQNLSNDHLMQHGSVHQISSLEARAIAVDFVGYGVAHDVQAFTDQNTLIFEVDVRNDAVRYVVLLNAESGNVTSLYRHEYENAAKDVSSCIDVEADEYVPQTTDEYVLQTTDEPSQPTANPTESGQENRPSNSAVSLDRAIEIASADLASRGISATYRSNSGIDWERGQRVWELLFITNGEHMPFIEYYINADNGNIVKFEWDD